MIKYNTGPVDGVTVDIILQTVEQIAKWNVASFWDTPTKTIIVF